MLVDEQELVDKYDNYILTQFIDTHKSMRFCPSPGCSKVAVGTGVISVQCACSNPFCFRCGEEVHEPALCDQLKDWTAKCSSESETANWILANTKKCPKCNARIEKNQGCNHMKCKNCSFDFCWTCMGPWSDHSQSTGGYYKCNRFIAPKDSSVERAKAELDRYLHFYQRYHDHNMSLKFAGNQLLGTEQRMIEMQEHGQDWSAVQYLKEATNVVINCRRVLKYTYVMGYFLEEKSEKEIAFKQLFEHHQEMLEKNTEGLSELTEKPLEELTREHVVNLTRVTANFLDSLLTAFQESERDVSAFLGSGEKSSSRK
jgi:ariadne-1